MVSYNAAHFSGLLNDAGISDETMESIVDAAIDSLNLLGASTISNMSGVAGAKTVSLTSTQHGAIVYAVRQVYLGVYRGKLIGTGAIQGQSISVSDVFANPTLVDLLKLAAQRLSDVAFVVAEDTSGIE